MSQDQPTDLEKYAHHISVLHGVIEEFEAKLKQHKDQPNKLASAVKESEARITKLKQASEAFGCCYHDLKQTKI